MIKYSLEISISDNQESVELNELKYLQITEKMADYALFSPEISVHSVLFDLKEENLTVSFDVMFCDDALMTEINGEYRGKDKPTDVITFALFADSEESRFVVNNTVNLGEIIVSTDTAKKQAEEYEKTFEQEMAFLISHGILHLLGFDHETEEKLVFMLSLQDKMIKHVQNDLG